MTKYPCFHVNYALSHRADVHASDQFFWTPLHHAAHAGQVEIIELLLKAGASIDARALSGGTPLMRAIESSRAAAVDFLINAGASVMAENKKGSAGNPEFRIVRLLFFLKDGI